MSKKDYDAFAWFFNRHWVTDIAPDILKALDKILIPQLSKRARVLDLCCGTGQIAAALSRRGFNVTGLDNSAEMLAFAKENAPRAKFVHSDARDFKFKQKFDAVVSTFDSVNHFLSLDEVEKVFVSVHRALKPNGVFVFDANTSRAFIENLNDDTAIVEDDNVCVLRAGYDFRTKTGRYDITMFRLIGGRWKRSDAVIEEKCFALRDLKTRLKNAGFDSIQIYYADRDLKLEEHEGRVFFLCRSDV
jgi:SAM-dependent methyltransferase